MSPVQAVIASILFTLLTASPAWARHESLADDQKLQLKNIERILKNAIALTDKVLADPATFRDQITARMVVQGIQPHSDP